jgi:hypothetical protein
MDVDLRAFRDATVTRPEEGDAFRHVRRAEELLYGADHVRNLAPTIAPGTPEDFENRWEAFLESDQRAEAIVSAGTLRGMADESPTGAVREALASERVGLYLYDGPIPLMLGVADGTVVLGPTDDRGVPTVLVETDDGTIRSWAEATLDEYRDRSRAVTADDLPP